MTPAWIAAYAALGMASGFFAGLLGVGGGAVMVPLLRMLFTAQHFPPEHVFHLALGTSMATIVFTSISSARAHPQLANMRILAKGNRLSITPVDPAEWKFITEKLLK